MNALTITLHLDNYDHIGLRTIAAFDGKTEDSVAREMITTIINSRMETMTWEWGTLMQQRGEKKLSPEDMPLKPIAVTDMASVETLSS